MTGRPVPLEPSAKRSQPKTVKPKAPADPPDSPTRSRRERAVHELIAFVVVFLSLIAVLASLAPTDYSKPVPASSIPDGSVTGPPCGYASPRVSATEVNSSGPYRLIRIVCSDGVPMLVAR